MYPVGAILAVLGVYARRVKEMLLGLVGRNPSGLRLTVQIVVAFLPAAVVGLLFNEMIKRWLFGLRPICAAWAVGGVVLLAAAAWLRRRGEAVGKDFPCRPYAGRSGRRRLRAVPRHVPRARAAAW